MVDWRLAAVRGRRLGYVAVAALMPAFALAAPMVPNKAAVPGEAPPARAAAIDPLASCTATGTYNEGGAALGSGTWTRMAKTKCRTPGNWTDGFTYSWMLRRDGHGRVAGMVTYHHRPGCTYDKWPVAGKIRGKDFSVTATNPAGTGDNCAQYFGYVMTIQ